MIKKLLLVVIVLITAAAPIFSQDFSNKGKEFWLCFPSHTPSGSNIAQMALFITSDKNSSGTISVNGFNTTFTVTANQVAGPINIPYANAHINFNQTGTVVNKGIHVLVDAGKPPVVVYAHIYAGFRSAASLILPVNVLGKKHYAASFWQASTSGSKSQFEIIAVDTNTTVKYQLRRNGVLSPTVNTVVLPNKGDVYQVQDDQDLTGSLIESVSLGPGSCKKIAVFSGSSSLAIGNGFQAGGSYDPLYQQLYPVNTWGKSFGVIPFANNPNGYHYRVIASEDNTDISIGAGPVITLNAGEFYPAASPNPAPVNTATYISASKPVSCVQYMMSSAAAGAPNSLGDPDMIVLNPVEQNINDITIFSSTLQAISQRYLSVYMQTSAAPSFRINNVPPTSSFLPMPGVPGFSYLVENLTNLPNPSFRLTADSGFNAIAYGLGNFESYGYSAGTNVRDLYQFITTQNPYATVNFPTACKGTPFYFSIVFPYKPTVIKWLFSGLFPDVTINNPVSDSSWIIGNRQVYRYKLPTPYLINTIGTFPIKVVVQNPTGDGCTGEQDIDYDLEVFPPPVADFNFTTNGCVTDSVAFFDNTNTGGRPITKWSWQFGDAGIDSIKNPKHLYTSPGSYDVKFYAITDVGCISDTATKTVVLNSLPIAKFGATAPFCTNKTITFTDSSFVTGSATLAKWFWDFGDGTPIVSATTNAAQNHIYTSTGTFTVVLKVETATGCQSLEYQKQVTIHPDPVADFSLPNVCLPAGNAQFNSLSTISDGSQSLLQYAWDFGDGNTAGNINNPLHVFAGPGPYTVTLTVTSNNGCVDDSAKQLTTIFQQPQANFTVDKTEVCIGGGFNFTDQSTAPNSTVTQWSWDFGDGTTSTVNNPSKTYAAAGTYTVTLSVQSAIGCPSTVFTRQVIVHALPTAQFNITGPACEGKNIQINDASVPNSGTLVKWTWDYGDATNAVLNNGAPFVHNYTNTGTYNVTLQVETDKGCVSTLVTNPVTVHVNPQAGFITPETCLSDPAVLFTDTSKISNGTITGWQWNFGDANATVPNPNTATVQNPTHIFTATGNYLATLIVTSDQGCTDTLAQSFDVNSAIPKADFTIQNQASLCSNEQVTIENASFVVGYGNIVKLEIYWDAANDISLKTTDEDPVAGKQYSFMYPEFGAPASKTVTIRVVAYSGLTCLEPIEKTFTLLATPTVQFDPVNGICEDVSPFQITEANVLNGMAGTGVFSGNGVSASGIFNPATAGAGTHVLRYTFTGTNGCENFREQTVEVFPVPVANAGPDKFVLEGGVVQLTPVLNAGFPVNYLWSPATGLDNPNLADPKASPVDDITYTLTVSSDKGCSTSDDVFVKVLKTPLIPNIFSPNGDGIHDKWVIDYLETYPGATVEIYNRYGQLVFRSIGYTQPWDGTVNGKPVPVGTYYYIVDPKNGRKRMAGYVDVIR
ncbi:MAG: PKD domain-containing protein [Terrimonas sp.]|nr:PKD domain-containing protein [Terrimonas sp.]